MQVQSRDWSRGLLALDLAMVALLCLNLALIIFDAFYAIAVIREGLDNLTPNLSGWYAQNIHANFLLIDLIFISLFLAEFIFSWTLSLLQKSTRHWYEYPLMHWYDLLGCIPLDAFRLLRVLRVFSILLRLHRMGWIDVTTWAPWRWAMGIYAMIVEEISDRVVINVLTGVQTELQSGIPIEDRIIRDVVAPRKQALSAAIAISVSEALEDGYSEHRAAISAWLAERVAHIIERNGGAKTLSRIPWLGESTLNRLESSIADTITDVLDETIAALNSEQVQSLLDEILQALIDRSESDRDDGEITGIIIEVLEVVKAQVAIKHYQAARTPAAPSPTGAPQ